MQDFLDDLEQRLSQVAAQEAPTPTRARSPRRRRPAILGGLTAALAASVAAFTMTGTSLAELPILKTETQDASAVAKAAPQAAAAGVDFAKAHPFGTPGGPGYVVVNRATDAVCAVVPDPDAPGEYGSSCERSIDKVERDGLSVSVMRPSAPGRPGRTLTVFVLPEDAEDVIAESGGRRFAPPLESGVAVIDLGTAGTLRWTVDGRPGKAELFAPFAAQSAAMITCPDGSTERVENVPRGQQDAASRKRFMELRREACRR